MKSHNFPKITFGIIVLNGEPFTRYCLKSIYPFAHEIIVVEGGHENTRLVSTPEGHSIDGTLETLYKFKKEEDPENKLTIVTRNEYWPKKDEFGKDRTPQSRAYAERASGDYLWQIDIDEFYRTEDLIKVLELLKNDPSISAITFPTYTFWGNINYISDSWALQRGAKYYHRLFKWEKGYKYLTHQPPTIIDDIGTDLREKHWMTGKMMAKKGIYMYHYSLLFPKQVENKVKVYSIEKPQSCSKIIEWAENNYFKLGNPFRVHNLYLLPSWLERFSGSHPEQVSCMIKDIQDGKVNEKLRDIEDVEKLLNSHFYYLRCRLLKLYGPIDDIFHKMISNFIRIKNIPSRIRRIINSNKHVKKL